MPKRHAFPGAGEGKGEGEGEGKGEAPVVPADRAQAAAGEFSDAVLHSRIAARAYALFLARGSQHGNDLGDWFQAEREVRSEERPAPDPEGP